MVSDLAVRCAACHVPVALAQLEGHQLRDCPYEHCPMASRGCPFMCGRNAFDDTQHELMCQYGLRGPAVRAAQVKDAVDQYGMPIVRELHSALPHIREMQGLFRRGVASINQMSLVLDAVPMPNSSVADQARDLRREVFARFAFVDQIEKLVGQMDSVMREFETSFGNATNG